MKIARRLVIISAVLFAVTACEGITVEPLPDSERPPIADPAI